ncbi:hypothetical protein D3C76_1872090 [compost metagenome]
MHHAWGFGEQEIVHQGAVAHDRLGADAGFVGQQVLDFQGWAILAALFQVAAFE